MVRSAARGVPDALAEQQQTGGGKIAQGAVGKLRNGDVGRGKGPNISENMVAERATWRQNQMVAAGHSAERTPLTLTPSACLGLSCRLAGDEGTVWSGGVALEGVELAIAFDGVFSWPSAWERRTLPVPATAKVSGTSRRKVAV